MLIYAIYVRLNDWLIRLGVRKFPADSVDQFELCEISAAVNTDKGMHLQRHASHQRGLDTIDPLILLFYKVFTAQHSPVT